VFASSGLMPRLVAMRPADYGLDPVLKSLSQCALRHLQAEPLCEQFDPLQPRHLQRWALQCLEHAETVLGHGGPKIFHPQRRECMCRVSRGCLSNWAGPQSLRRHCRAPSERLRLSHLGCSRT
jgi:hypothetical protein